MLLDEFSTSMSNIVEQSKCNLYYLSVLILVIFGLFVVTRLTSNRLLYLGIIPRRWYGLPGIICSPFLHMNYNHLFFNSIPLLVLSNFILFNGLRAYIYISLSITLISGLLIWCCAKPGIYVGASAIVTGYWGFLVSKLFHHPDITGIILGIMSIYYFYGIFLGIFPQQKGIAWEGHLFGLLAGIATSYYY